MGILADGMLWLSTTLSGGDGVAVLYTPRGGAAVALTAVPGERRDEAEPTQAPGRLERAERDYLIALADWTAAGLTGTPATGDRVVETINGVGVTFEAAPTGVEPSWRYSDPGRTAFRVHCKPVP